MGFVYGSGFLVDPKLYAPLLGPLGPLLAASSQPPMSSIRKM